MPIKQQTPNAEVERYLEAKARSLHRALVNNLIYVGEAAVKEARENHRYENQTGNLQSSIGYCVVDDGKVINGSSFDVVKTGAQGSQEGRKFLTRLVSEHSSGLVLIVVAGMDYAAYVEAKNLNVLDSAEQMSERLIPQLMKQLKI